MMINVASACVFCLAPKHPGPCAKPGHDKDGGGDGGSGGGGGGEGGGGGFDAKAAEAKTGDEALDSAPVRMGDLDGKHARGSLSPDEHHALMYYRGEGYRQVTPALYRGNPSPAVAGRVGHMDAAMGKSHLQEPVIVHRGITSPHKLFGRAAVGRDMTGMEWTDRAFQSTSTDARHAAKFARAGSKAHATQPTVMRIYAPRGTRGITLSGSRMGGESEVLLDRGLRFRIVHDHGERDGVRHLDVEIIG